MSAVKNILQTGLQSTWAYTSRLVGIVALGILLNIIFFFLIPDRCQLSLDKSYIYVLKNCFPAFVIGLLFLVGFPIAYFFVAQQYAIQKVIETVYIKHKDEFYEYLTDNLIKFTNNNKSLAGSLQAGNVLHSFFKKLDNLPFIFRIVVKYLSKKIPLIEIAEQVSQQANFTQGNTQAAAKQLSDKAQSHISDELLNANKLWLILLLIFNIMVFIAVKIF